MKQIGEVFFSDELWCVHVLGPDTLIAMPDYPTAVKRAQEWISMFREISTGSPFEPILHCNVIEWDGTPEGHAEQLAEHGGNPEDIC